MKKHLVQLIILNFLFLLSNPVVDAQERSDFYFSHVNGENGLSASNVKAVLQDSYGFMWFGTKNGLNRYDGTSILQFNCDDLVAGVGNHNIAALFEDKQRNLWVGTDRGVYIYDPKIDVFTHFNLASPEGITLDNWVGEILSDSLGNIWILIPDQGLFRYKDEAVSFYTLANKDNLKNKNPECICTNDKGEVWVGTSGVGIFKYDPQQDKFVQYLTDRNGRSLVDKTVISICFQGENAILAIHEGDLLKYNTRTNELSDIPFLGDNKTFLRDVMCFEDEIWVGSLHGVFIINEKKNKVTHLKEDLMRSFSLSDNSIYSIYRDHEGGIWIGTMFGGANYLPNRELTFDKYVPGSNPNSLNTKRIRGLAEDNEGRIWIGTEDNGVNVLDPQTGDVHQIHDHVPGRLITLCVRHYNDQVYVGLLKQGMNVISLPGEHLRYVSDTELGIEEGSVYSFLIDSKGRRWIGPGWGLYMSPSEGEKYQKIDQVGYAWIYDIMEAKDGMIWIATMGNGIWKCNPETGACRNYYFDEPKSSNSVSSIMQDSKGNLWFSTDRGGICRYNEAEDNFTRYSIDEGLPDDVAYNILEDDKGNLWFGTNKGLVRFNPENGDIRVFTNKDGLLGNQFNYQSALKARDGRFYFGGVDGLIAFDPNIQEEEKPLPPVYISKFSIYNKEVTVHTPDSPLKQCIAHTDQIVLPYDQSNISFDVALLSYSTAESNQYYYRMEPLDRDWVKAASNQNISYAKLPPGRYTFRVQATHGSKSEPSTRSLSIVILPPWWQSVLAYIIYTVVVILIIIGTILWYKRRKERQLEERQKLFEIEKEKELYESKVDFFTEIAHEVRTPLTLINGPLEAIEEMGIQEPRMKKYINVMVQNTKRLLELTGQLLDFQKIGANKLTMKFESVDITELLKGVVERFEVTYSLNRKELQLKSTDEPVWAAVDKEAITKILSNLLNNGLKYANSNVLVELEKGEDSFTIRVTSDGNKIPAEASQYIFEPFYQMERKEKPRNGVGIGLSLSRSLASLHQGTIYLDTSHKEENVFVLTIPLNGEGIKLENSKAIQKDIVSLDEQTPVSADIYGYTLLLVEDNESMLTFIHERLQENFTVETAKNGAEALEVLRSGHIDLIISDIMMPVMDGYQLCKEVKSDMELSHIPIIFLTAKNDIDSKINGLKYGAEAYVEKPFSFNYLKEQVLSLLDNRRREREAFAKRPFFSVNNMQMNKADEEFMNKVIKIIEDNITDDNFGVERMADILCMSRSSLLRKIKTLFNLSPLDFIRLIKLKKAAEYIQEGKYRIGDICFMVGINSPSYFSKLFLKQFGMTPKDFEKQSQSGKQIIITQEIKNVDAGNAAK